MKHPTVIFFYFFYIHYLIKLICVNTHRGTDIMNLFYLFFFQIAELKGFRLKNVDIELSGSSTYHIYVYLAEMGIIKNIPRWVADTREKGKTHCKAKFS